MTAIRGYVPPTADEAAIGIHSLDQFVLAVPDLKAAQHFYGNFGLDILIEVKVAPKVSPDRKVAGPWVSCPEGVAGAPLRSKAWAVHPRRLSPVLCFTPDIDRAIDFHAATLGLRLSDRSDFVAFMHGIH